jgi:hypothetical protein
VLIESNPELQAAMKQLRDALGLLFACGLSQFARDRVTAVCQGLRENHRARFTIGIELGSPVYKLTCSVLEEGSEETLFELEDEGRFFWMETGAELH